MSETAVSFNPTEQMTMVQQMARDFAEKEIKPNVMKYDQIQVCNLNYENFQG